jgi:hypothetical protein
MLYKSLKARDYYPVCGRVDFITMELTLCPKVVLTARNVGPFNKLRTGLDTVMNSLLTRERIEAHRQVIGR